MPETLKTFQDDFYEALFGDPTLLFAHTDLSAETFNARLTVYRNNVLGSLTDVLSSTFAHTSRALRAQVFRKLSHAFIRQNPPQKNLLNMYGEHFPDFLTHQELLDKVPLWISDLARLEWSLQKAYYAEDVPALTQKQLSTIKPEQIPHLVFQAAPSLGIFQSGEEGLLSYCHDHLGSSQAQPSSFYQVGGEPSGQALITRLGFQTKLIWVNPTLYDFVEGLSCGKALGRTVEELSTKHSDVDLTALLTTSFQLGCFSGVKTSA